MVRTVVFIDWLIYCYGGPKHGLYGKKTVINITTHYMWHIVWNRHRIYDDKTENNLKHKVHFPYLSNIKKTPRINEEWD
jgi:hypothetical protein